METTVLMKVQERRVGVHLADVIDQALDLAEECGWRYAIAFLISENVPSPIIQRLLFGGNIRRSAKTHRVNGLSWNGGNVNDMSRLFESLQQRRANADYSGCDAPRASGARARSLADD